MTQWIAAIARGHNSGVCLLKDGEMVFSIEEERLSRKKYDGGPLASMIKILDYTDRLDYLVVAHTQPLDQAGSNDFTGEPIYTALARKLGLIDRKADIYKHPQVVDYSHIHHKLHSSCAFFRSGFESAVSVIVDGAGTFIPMEIDREQEMTWELETIIQCAYPDNFKILNKDKFICRALDNRIGGFVIAEVARLVFEKKNKLPFGLYVTNSVQEEVGLRGAEMITENIKPDIAIVTDVCHDTTTPMINKKEQGLTKIGEGPVISYAPAIQNNLREKIINTALKNKIPFQRLASSRYTGTDTDAFAYSNGGVASALISLPLRYMHTTVEMVQKSDIENLIELIYSTLLEINPKENLSYFK